MDADRYEQIGRIYDEASRLDAADRGPYLDEACGHDTDLQARVLAMLAESAGVTSDDLFSDRRIHDARDRLEQALPGRPPADAAPQAIGGYRIVRRLAAGGMGTVYEAEQETPHRRVAVKMVHAHVSTPALLERLRREAEILGRLQHPGIAQVFDAGSFDDGEGARPWFAMEFIDGRPLGAYADEQDLDVRQRIELLCRVCDAVQYAHERDIVHRDLKPDNVLVDERGQPKILDFGIARVTAESTIVDHSMTMTGQIIGTLGYMAPEQLSGQPDAVTPRADVYALGVMLYELLTGQQPHAIAGMSLTHALRTICDETPRPLHAHDASLRGDLTTITEKAIDVEPERRYASAGALATDLRRWIENRPILARPTSRVYLARKYVRRNRTLVGGAAATITVLLVGLVVAIVLAGQREVQRDRADARTLEARRNQASLIGPLQASTLAAVEADRPVVAWTQHRGMDESLRGWTWRLLDRAMPLFLDYGFVPTHGNFSFVGDDRIIWHAKQGEPIGHMDLRTGVTRMLFADAGIDAISYWQQIETGLMMAARGEELLLLDVNNETIRRTWPRRYTGVVTSNVSDDGRIVTVYGDDSIEVYVDDAEPWIIEGEVPMIGAKLTNDGRLLAVGHGSGLRLFDVRGREEVYRIEPDGIEKGIIAVFDTGLFYTSTPETEVMGRRIEWRDGTVEIGTTRVLGAYATTAGHSRDGSVSIARGADHGSRGDIELRDGFTGALLRTIRIPGSAAADAKISPGYRRLAVHPLSDQIWIIDLDRGGDPSPFSPIVCRGHGTWIYHLAVSADGSLVVSAAPDDDVIRLWDARTGEQVGGLRRRLESAATHDAVMFFTGNDDRLVATAPMPGMVGVAIVAWDLARGGVDVETTDGAVGRRNHEAFLDRIIDRFEPAPRQRLNQKIQMIDDTALVVARETTARNARRRVQLAGDGARWRTVREPGIGEADTSGMALHPTEPLVAVVSAGMESSDDNRLHIRRIGDGIVEAEILLDRAPWCVAWSPDGALLAVGDDGGFVTIYDAEFLAKQLSFQAHDAPRYPYVYSIAWTADGQRLVTASGDETVKVWDGRSRFAQAIERDAWVALRERMAAREDLLDIYPTLSGDERAAARIELIRRHGVVETTTARAPEDADG